MHSDRRVDRCRGDVRYATCGGSACEQLADRPEVGVSVNRQFARRSEKRSDRRVDRCTG